MEAILSSIPSPAWTAPPRANGLRTTNWIFNLSSILIPFTVVGFEIKGIAVYLAMLLPVLDWRFCFSIMSWVGANFRARPFKVIFALLFIFVTASSSVNFQLGILKCIWMLFAASYFGAGIIQYGTRFINFGIVAAIIVALIQFLECLYFKSSFFSANNISYELSSGIRVGLGIPSGGSYAPGILASLPRVSGPTREPAYFSSILIALLPFCRASKRMALMWALGIVFCFSKVTMPQLLGVFFIWLIWRCGFKKHLIIIFFSMYISLVYVLFRIYEGFFNLGKLAPTFFDRLVGAAIFFHAPMSTELMGNRFFSSCLSRAQISFSIGLSEETLKSIGIESGCYDIGMSGPSSFLLSNGILGVISIYIFFMISRYHQKNLRVEMFAVPEICVCIYFLSLLSLHYLTAFPPFVLLIGSALAGTFFMVPNSLHRDLAISTN